jgi:hypothetical protein
MTSARGENIAVGDLSVARESRCWPPRAGIHDALVTLPKGYDTMLTVSYYDLADKEDPHTGSHR